MPEPKLKLYLDRLYQKYQDPQYLTSDPLEFVVRYKDPFDQEVVGLLAALLAYGKVKQIRASVASVLTRMATISESPSQLVRSLNEKKGVRNLEGALQGFVHRFNVGSDVAALLRLLHLSWVRYGSLGLHFESHGGTELTSFEIPLSRVIEDWRAWDRDLGLSKAKSFEYLLTSPLDGSCCKRWCLFLRWMGRKDRLDPGTWVDRQVIRSDQLVIPLDTHTGRISQYLKLTERKSLGWQAALEVTQSLKQICPEDPTRYDFALSRLGILDLCQKQFRVEICNHCDLISVCKFATSKMG